MTASALAPERAGRRRMPRSIVLGVGLTLVGLTVVLALVSLAWLPYDLADTSGSRLEPPSAAHWLGTDRLGRDLFSQLMVGARIALLVGVCSVLVGALVGVTIGILAGFAGRWLDDTLSAALDILIAFPVLLLAMLIVAALGASMTTAILAIGVAMSSVIARFTRILTKRVLSQQYVVASRTSGTSWPGVVLHHVLPNIWPALVVQLALQFGVAVLAEASLSYLGLGAPPPNASWGRLLQEAQQTVSVAPLGALAPGVALVTLVIGINLVADGLREVADPTRRRSR